MDLKVGDRVSYPAICSTGQLIVPAGTGRVLAIKADDFNKNGKIVVTVATKNTPIEIYARILHKVN